MDKNFSGAQEAVREDVECTFGMLIYLFHILERPLRLWSDKELGIVVNKCVVNHNLVVQKRRNDYESGLCGLKFLNEEKVKSVQEGNISYTKEDKMPRGFEKIFLHGQKESYSVITR